VFDRFDAFYLLFRWDWQPILSPNLGDLT
jgi:hypothetical protein